MTFRYAISTGLSGCYLPDSVSGPITGTTRRELVAAIRAEIEMMDWPKSTIRQVAITRLWHFVKRYGSSKAHFSISHKGVELAFHGLTEDEATQMEVEH